LRADLYDAKDLSKTVDAPQSKLAVLLEDRFYCYKDGRMSVCLLKPGEKVREPLLAPTDSAGSETEMGRRALLIFEKNDDRAAFVSSERARP
jgi:hypothetical protein